MNKPDDRCFNCDLTLDDCICEECDICGDIYQPDELCADHHACISCCGECDE